MHGMAWPKDAPDVEKLKSLQDDAEFMELLEEIVIYADNLVSTMNPGISADGSDAKTNAPLPKTKPHVCNKSYSEVDDLHADLLDLIATTLGVQLHIEGQEWRA